MRLLLCGTVLLLLGACAHTRDPVQMAETDLGCPRGKVLFEEGENRLIARGCGKRATYTYVARRHKYSLDSIEPDSDPVPRPREPLPSLADLPCKSDTECNGNLVCRDSRCVP